MMPDEKTQLLDLLEREDSWCRDAEAHDAAGNPVTYDDRAAVAWDLTGALCRLFGWQRACVLFGQMERHIVGRKRGAVRPGDDPAIEAMKSLQDFNDHAETSFAVLRERLEAMPVWNSGKPADEWNSDQAAEASQEAT